MTARVLICEEHVFEAAWCWLLVVAQLSICHDSLAETAWLRSDENESETFIMTLRI